MNCNQAKERFFDGMEPGSELATHVSGCAACAAELKSLQATMTLLDEWKAPEPSAFFRTRLQGRLAEARREAPAAQGWLAWVRKPVFLRPALVAAMGLAFVLGMNFYHPAMHNNQTGVVASVAKGTAVGDLQALDKNQELYADFDLLDDIGSSHARQDNAASQSAGSEL